jgi:hypothetical protein
MLFGEEQGDRASLLRSSPSYRQRVARPAAGQISVEERSYGARRGAAAFRDREAVIGGAPVSVRMHQQRGIRDHRLRQRPQAQRDYAGGRA